MPRGAPVKVLPPLLYVLPFAGGWLVERAAPTTLHLGVAALLLGWSALAAGFGLMVWAAVTLRRRGTTVLPWGHVSALAGEGPYRWTRNPIYLGDVLAYLGATLLLDSAWPLLLLPVIVVLTYRLVVRHEEAYLARTFTTTYAAYRRRVRRWV